MATITSIGSGLWSAAGTWDSDVPANNDDVVIASGHEVEFDVDQSGFADGIDGITITGTLKLTRTAGTYYMKIKAGATINGAGTFDCGTDGDEIPFAAKHTITGGAGWYINGASGLTMTVYAAEPTYTYVKLSAAEAAGQTVLSVDTDVTGDIWAAGDEIQICNIDSGQDDEKRTIAAGGIAAGEITTTAGLTNAKIEGAFIQLLTRNVVFISQCTSTSGLLRDFTGLSIYGGQWTGNGKTVMRGNTSSVIGGGVFHEHGLMIYSEEDLSILDGVFCNNTYSVFSSNGASISGGIFTGNTAGISTSIGSSISGGIFGGNNYGIVNVSGCVVVGGSIYGNIENIRQSSLDIKGVSLVSATADMSTVVFSAYNTLFGSAIENYNYETLSKQIYSESIDHNQVQGAYKAWTKGGVTTLQSSVYPTGFTDSYNIVLEDADNEGYFQREISVGAGQSVNFDLNLRKDGAMTYLPRFQIFLKRSTDPFAGGTPEHTFTMTDSVDTWESETYTYSNDGTEGETLVIRCLGKAASGNVYGMYEAEVLNVDLTDVLANLATVDGIVDAIKAVTDQFNFTVANQVDANALTGGTSATEIREEMDDNSTKLAAILEDTETDIPALLAAVQSNLDNPDQYKADVSALALEATLDAIKGTGWTNEDLVTIKAAIDDILVDTGTTLPASIATAQADLDNPDQYKADVSSLALETTLDAIKGIGWTDETLVAIKTVIDAILVDTNTSLPALLSSLQSWIATETNSSASASAITQIKGDTWEIKIDNVILDSNKQQFVVKRSYDSSDNSALLFIDNIAGLIRANGSEADDPTKASLSYSASALKLTVNVDASITSELPVKEGVYGIQSITSGSVVSEPYIGTFNIIADVVNASE